MGRTAGVCGARGTATRSAFGRRAIEIGFSETGAGFRLGRDVRAVWARLGATLRGPSAIGRAAGTAPSGTFSRAWAGRGRTALAGVVTAGYLGSIVGPLAIGFTADVTGLRTALWIPAALAAAIVAFAGSLRVAAGRTARPA